MKKIITLTFLGLAAALPATAKPQKNCAVVYATGDSCKNLQAEFNLKGCGITTTKKANVSCGGNSATASVNHEKWTFTANLKRFVGQSSAVWDVNSDVRVAEKQTEKPAPPVVAETKPEEKPQPEAKPPVVENAAREVAAAVSAPATVSAAAVVSAAPVAVATPPVVSAAPVAVATPPAAPTTPVVTPAPVSAAAEVKPEYVPTWKNNSLIQFWYLEDQSPSATAADTNFRVRRAELKLTGSTAENTRWFFLADFAKGLATTTTSVVTSTSPTTKTSSVVGINTDGDSKILQDVGVAIKLMPDLEVTLGQFKLPIVGESQQPTSELLFAERSLLARTYGERRDPGAMLTYKYEKLKFAATMSNGQGPNVDEKNKRKDYAGRVEATLPAGFNVGAFVLCKEAICYDPNRYGVNLGWTWGDLSLRGEYVNANISAVRSTAHMFDAGYKLSDKWQLATRYESLQPNVANSFKSSAATVGFNYFLSKQNLKLQLNHSQLFNMKGNNGSYSSTAGQNGSLIIFAVQNSF